MKALVLSGGGVKGAWQAGVIYRLVAEERNYYSILCGVSVGALNAAYLAGYERNQTEVSGKNLVSVWKGIDQSKVYRRWFPFGRLQGIFKSSLYDSSPLQKWVRENLNSKAIQSTGRLLRVGAVSLTTGRYRVFDEDYHDIPGAVLASSSFPGMLCPIELEGELWSDGGVREITPLKAALDAGATEVDIVLCNPSEPSQSFPKKPKTLDIAMRAIDLMGEEILSDDIEKAKLINLALTCGVCSEEGQRKVRLRVFRPPTTLCENNLDFRPGLVQSLLDRGYYDSRQWAEGLRLPHST